MTKAAVMFAGLLAFTSFNVHAHKPAKCGSKSKHTVVSTIALSGPRADEGASPVYYFHTGATNNVLFFRPADAIATLREMIEREEKWRGPGKATGLRGMAAELEKDQPLEEHTDLNKYALLVPGYHPDGLVTEMLRAGRASVGYWNYFDLHPKAATAPIKSVTLYLAEDSSHLFSAEFCSESGWTVYYYVGEID